MISRVGVLSRSFSRHPVLRAELGKLGYGLKFNDGQTTLSDEALLTFLADCDAAIVALETIDAQFLDQLPALRVISKYGVGCDNIDLRACATRGIRVGWTPGVNRRSVAELTLAFMLGLMHEVPRATNLVRDGSWQQLRGRLLSSATVGIIGFGHVGREVAMMLRPFECKLLANDVRDVSAPAAALGVECVPFETLVKGADIVTLHVPLTSATRYLIDARAIQRMKRGAVIINTSRGAVLDEAALAEALDDGRIAGAGLDVFEIEPPLDTKFASRPNVIATPHIGGSTEEAVLAMGRAAIRGLADARNPLDLLPDYPT